MVEGAKKRVKYRRLVQLLFAGATNSYVTGFAAGKIYQGDLKRVCHPGLNCYSCPGAVLSCPIGSLQAVIGSRPFAVSAYVFGLILIFGALMGRFVCGFLCPFGLVQELLHKIPFPWKRNRFGLDKYLRYLKYAALLVLVILLPMVVNNAAGSASPYFCKWACPAGALEGGVPLVLLNPSAGKAQAAQAAPAVPKALPNLSNMPVAPDAASGALAPQAPVYQTGALFAWKMALMTFFLLFSMVNYRPFCKYLCPLGAMYGLLNPVALYRLRIDRALCIRCGACARKCPMCLDPVQTQNHPECVRCGECVNICPTAALSLGWGPLPQPGPAPQPAAGAKP